jgi:hypothetical protein
MLMAVVIIIDGDNIDSDDFDSGNDGLMVP